MAEDPRGLGIWFAAARPRTLPAAAAPVLMGTAIAWRADAFDALPALLALLGALAIQIGTNFANDYFDHRKGADTPDRLGPTRATAAGLVPPRAMRNAFLLAFAFALAVGSLLVLRGGLPVVVIGLASIAFGVLYTGGPFALAYLGIADLFVLVFFGPVAVAGTYYVQALEFSPQAAVAGLGPGLLAVALLTVNNLRDRETDARVGKRTLVVRLGRTFAKGLYTGCLFGALGVPAVLLWGFDAPVAAVAAVALAMLLVAPAPLRVVLRAEAGQTLAAALAGTGRLLVVYGLAFSIGWLL